MAGSNPQLDKAIQARPQILDFLRQDAGAECPRKETLRRLGLIAAAVL